MDNHPSHPSLKMSRISFVVLVFIQFTATNGHAFIKAPRQRGLFGGANQAPELKRVLGAPVDWSPHFPAGDKRLNKGAGMRSQIKAAAGRWSPFCPEEPDFVWRAGVCGDEKGKKQDHLRSGKFYFNAYRAATYKQGQTIKITISVIAHHNGYMELHVCDVKKCNGEISPQCFRNGHCKLLHRASNPICDEGQSKRCGPIDQNYPGRWYFPCDDHKSGAQTMGGKYAKFELPDDLVCDHCVLHWFHSAANHCNPPGVIEYFDGQDSPKAWGDCKGQGGAEGGVSRVQGPCGADRMPEEYYQCADIRITPVRD